MHAKGQKGIEIDVWPLIWCLIICLVRNQIVTLWWSNIITHVKVSWLVQVLFDDNFSHFLLRKT